MTWLESIWPWVFDNKGWPLILAVMLLGLSILILFDRADYWLADKIKTTSGSIVAFAVIVTLLAVSGLADYTDPLELPEHAVFEEEMADLRESNRLTMKELAAAEASLEDARLRLAAGMAKEERLAKLEDQLAATQNELASLRQRHASQENATQQAAELEAKLIEMEKSQFVALQEAEEELKNANVILETIGWDELTSEKMPVEVGVSEPPIPLPQSIWEAVQSNGGKFFVLFGIDEKAHLQAYYPEGIAKPEPFEELVESQYRIHLAVEVGDGKGCWMSPEGYRECLAFREPGSP